MQPNVGYQGYNQMQQQQMQMMMNQGQPQFGQGFTPEQYDHYQQQMMFMQQQYGVHQLFNPKCWEQHYRQPPPDGPYPGTTNEEYATFNVQQQQEFQRFLKSVGEYYSRFIPLYQSKMYEFYKRDPSHPFTPEETKVMKEYIEEQDYKEYLKELEQSQSEVVNEAQQPEQTVQPVPTVEPNAPAPVKERKKLNVKSKTFEKEKPPLLPKLPATPTFIDSATFFGQYQQFLDFYQPSTEFTRFPTPEEEVKRQEEQKKKQAAQDQARLNREEKQKKFDEMKRQRALLKGDENRFTGMKEEKVNIDDLTIDTNIFIEPDETRQPINLVFIGHVDAGKSTLCGRILVDAKEISPEDIRKFELEAKENNRESWWLAYCMDINEEERAKGKTVECGKAQFQTQTKRFTLFDAPGHKNYIPNMIMGACQADLAGLIISAKTGEFESGFQKGGQTQEHALLAKSLGVQHLLVIVTKMDTVDWDQKRFDEIVEAIQKFIQDQCQFQSIHIIPIDALVGDNCSTPVDPARAPWYKGPTLMQLLDDIPIHKPDPEGPIRIPILDKLRDQGLFVFGKVESGTIVDGLNVTVLPRRIPFQIIGIYNSKDQRMKYAKAGENVKLKVKGLEDDDLSRGHMVCNLESQPCPISQEFQVRIRILELPEHKRIMSEGYTCVLHLHCLVEEVEISGVEAFVDPITKKLIKQTFLKSGQDGIVKFQVKTPVCLEKADFINSLGRFALRDEGRSIAFGEVLKIKPLQPKREQVLLQQSVV